MTVKINKIYYLVFAFFYIMTNACSSNGTYKKIAITLNNENGVPFYYDGFDYVVDGFEIDDEENFYFLAGDNAILTCFNKTQNIYRKHCSFNANQIYTINNKIYIFDYKYEKNDLYILDKKNGNVIKKYQNILKNRVNSFLFKDTSLIVEVFNYQNIIDITTERGFLLFSLSGQFIEQVDNLYNLPTNQNPKSRTIQFLGQWDDNFIYWDFDVDNMQNVFILKNKEGNILAIKRFEAKEFEMPFYGNPIEHRKLRNGKIYVLGHNGKSAIITVLILEELFKW